MSIAAIMHRAHDLKLINASSYRQFCITRNKKGWRRAEPGKYSGDEKSSRFEQLVPVVVNEDVAFSRRLRLFLPPDFEAIFSG
jgi:Zn-dependent peptidase ImmA (M78 family)